MTKAIIILGGTNDGMKWFKEAMNHYFIVKNMDVREINDVARVLIGCKTRGIGEEFRILAGTFEDLECNPLDTQYDVLANEIEKFREQPEIENNQLMIIEHADKKLSNAIQDDFPIFEIFVSNENSVLPEDAFKLNYDCEDFRTKAWELVTKLSK